MNEYDWNNWCVILSNSITWILSTKKSNFWLQNLLLRLFLICSNWHCIQDYTSFMIYWNKMLGSIYVYACMHMYTHMYAYTYSDTAKYRNNIFKKLYNIKTFFVSFTYGWQQNSTHHNSPEPTFSVLPLVTKQLHSGPYFSCMILYLQNPAHSLVHGKYLVGHPSLNVLCFKYHCQPF